MKAAVVLVFLFGVSVSNAGFPRMLHLDNSQYYWRDYDGFIPPDAFPAGKGSHNDTTYIGQTIHRKVGVVVPGKICPVLKTMYFEFDNLEHEETVDVKILCSLNHFRFEWVPVEINKSVYDIGKSRRLIIGGHDRPTPVAIGRKLMKNAEVQVGKVLVIDEKFEAIYITGDGKGYRKEKGYEVLVYNPTDDVKYPEGLITALFD